MRQAMVVRRVAASLTQREWEVLAAVATGQTTREVARELELSPQTIRTHLRHIFAKLGVHTRSEAVRAGFALLLATNPWVDLRDHYRAQGAWPPRSALN